MRLFKKLWKDEAGVLLSAEAAVVGTVGVVALGTGMSLVGSAVNEELKEVAYAIRSLDQSYSIPGQKGCGAWTAGSEFKQQPVEESLQELKEVERELEATAKKQSQRLQERVENQKKREAQRKRRMEKRKKKQKQKSEEA